jgi:SAM-dependent methyltransferase
MGTSCSASVRIVDYGGNERHYEKFADEFLEHAEDGFANAYIDRPACLELLGDVRGKRVLDAACGPGLYAAELLRRGAGVTGFDASPRMVEICRDRVPAGTFRVHDLGRPLDWAPDASFDLVLCALAIQYADDRVATLRELRRVLRPDGALVLSRQHPAGDWLRHGGSYFDIRLISETWSTGWQVSYWLAPLEVTCREIAAAGFLIERLTEPRPLPAGEALDPDEYERLSREPRGFMAFRLVPDPRSA